MAVVTIPFNLTAQRYRSVLAKPMHKEIGFIGNRTFFGKGSREEAAKALTYLGLTWKDDESRQVRAHFRCF